MSNAKKRMTVSYFVPGEEIDGKARFKYVLNISEGARPGAIRVNIGSLALAGTEGTYPHAHFDTRTDDENTAILGALAVVNSHHGSLKSVPGEIIG